MSADIGVRDELDEAVAEWNRDPEFRAALIYFTARLAWLERAAPGRCASTVTPTGAGSRRGGDVDADTGKPDLPELSWDEGDEL